MFIHIEWLTPINVTFFCKENRNLIYLREKILFVKGKLNMKNDWKLMNWGKRTVWNAWIYWQRCITIFFSFHFMIETVENSIGCVRKSILESFIHNFISVSRKAFMLIWMYGNWCRAWRIVGHLRMLEAILEATEIPSSSTRFLALQCGFSNSLKPEIQ